MVTKIMKDDLWKTFRNGDDGKEKNYLGLKLSENDFLDQNDWKIVVKKQTINEVKY